MRNREDAKHLAREEIDLLQGCLDSLLTTHRLPKQCERADLMSKALLLAYARGIRDSASLIAMATSEAPTTELLVAE